MSNCTFVEPKKLIKNIEREKYDYVNYRLYNKSSLAKHYLNVSQNKKTGTVTLTGSLRKRSYNRVTLLDMSQSMFVQTLKGIAKELCIPFEELRRAKFTQCEIGANIRTRIPAIDILPLVVDYAHYERNDNYIEKGTLYFNGTDRLLKLYVKDDEIAAHSFSEEKRELKKMSFDRLKAKGIHHLRIEFTMKTHRSFKNKGGRLWNAPPSAPLSKIKSSETVDFIGVSELFLRSVADLNCCTRFCRPLPNRSANRPCCDFALQR